jgi:hypothetical protein
MLTLFVKMPIRDGYSATHAIRTEAPWRDIPEVRSVPIVAMVSVYVKTVCETYTDIGPSLFADRLCDSRGQGEMHLGRNGCEFLERRPLS